VRRIALALAAGLLIAMPAQAQDRFAGEWSGLLDVGTLKLHLVFHVVATEDGYTATLDSPDQGARGMVASDVTVTGDSVSIEFAQLGARYDARIAAEGTRLEGKFSQGGQVLPLDLEPGVPDEVRRPQNPEPPYPYDVEDVSFPGGAAGVELAGTLTLPRGGGRHPAAILVSGSGPQNRDEEIFQHRPFLVLADYLTRRGVAVLRYDDRGVGESTGNFGTATSLDFADDAEAAFRFLRARDEVEPDEIGVVGHSEGGIIAQLLAARLPQLAYVVMIAGPGVPGDSILLLQVEALNRVAGLPETTVEARVALQRRLMDVALKDLDPEQVRAELAEVFRSEAPGMTDEQIRTQSRVLTSPWMHWFLHYDPRPMLREMQVPVLAVIGSKDLQVLPDENLSAISEALREGGNPDHTVLELEGLNHLLQSAETGLGTEYGQIEETMAPAALETIGDWIVERFGGS
jgi:pimeloyl-ACP methyl ester carboxylesterase